MKHLLPIFHSFPRSFRLNGNSEGRKTTDRGCERIFVISTAMKLFCLGIAHFLKNYIKVQGVYRRRTAISSQEIMDVLGAIPFHNLLVSSQVF